MISVAYFDKKTCYLQYKYGVQNILKTSDLNCSEKLPFTTHLFMPFHFRTVHWIWSLMNLSFSMNFSCIKCTGNNFVKFCWVDEPSYFCRELWMCSKQLYVLLVGFELTNLCKVCVGFLQCFSCIDTVRIMNILFLGVNILIDNLVVSKSLCWSKLYYN